MNTVNSSSLLLLISSIILSLNSPTYAEQDVKYFYNPDNGNSAFINLNSMHRDGYTAVATVKWLLSDELSNMGVSVIELNIKADCKNRILQSLGSKSYSKNGTLVKDDNNLEILPIGQGNKQEATFDVVCGTKKPFQTLLKQFVSSTGSSTNQ